MKKAFATWIVLIVLLVSIVGTAAGQSGEDPTATPTPLPTLTATEETPAPEPTAVGTEETPTAVPTTPPGSKFFTHPVVQVLSAYFDRPRGVTPLPSATPDPSVTPDPLATPDPSATPDPGTGSGLGPIGEQIAAYHEQGMGFGVLVKVYAMVEASEDACGGPGATPVPGAEPCVPLTAEELVGSLQSGTGVGALFKEYGKPALLGVGHVRKKVKEMGGQPQPTEIGGTPVVEPAPEGTPSALDAGNNPGKGNNKGNNGNGGNPAKGNNGKGNNGKGPKK